MEGLDQDKPIIVIDHQPKQLQELADAGTDLDLGGHTHDGQMFPGQYHSQFHVGKCLRLHKKTGYALHRHLRGRRLYPNMRVGTKSEIVEINVSFTN